MDAQLTRILDEDFLVDLADRPVEGVRSARSDCREVETQLSYLRRLVQGQHDVLTAEASRRELGGAPDDVHGLVERLPSILADRERGGGSGRNAAAPRPEDLTGPLADRFAELAARVPLESLGTVTDDELRRTAADLTALEADVSAARRGVFERIDVVEAELLRRYRDGDADADDLLGGAEAPPV